MTIKEVEKQTGLARSNIRFYEKEKLIEEKNTRKEKHRLCHSYEKELDTVCSNVDAILGRTRTQQRKKEMDIS